MSRFTAISMSFDNVGAARGGHMLFAGLSFTINSSEVMWIQGANGIGKTTLLRLAAGLSRPDEGVIDWVADGANTSSRELIAFQGHRNALKSGLSAQEDLKFWAKIYGYNANIEQVLESVGLSNRKNVACGALSAGQGRRLAVARLLVSNKPLWVMDEPAAAMDTEGQALILDAVNRHASRGGAALIASHDAAQSFDGRTTRLTLEPATLEPA